MKISDYRRHSYLKVRNLVDEESILFFVLSPSSEEIFSLKFIEKPPIRSDPERGAEPKLYAPRFNPLRQKTSAPSIFSDPLHKTDYNIT